MDNRAARSSRFQRSGKAEREPFSERQRERLINYPVFGTQQPSLFRDSAIIWSFKDHENWWNRLATLWRNRVKSRYEWLFVEKSNEYGRSIGEIEISKEAEFHLESVMIGLIFEKKRKKKCDPFNVTNQRGKKRKIQRAVIFENIKPAVS